MDTVSEGKHVKGEKAWKGLQENCQRFPNLRGQQLPNLFYIKIKQV